jgi:hypothetical protein
MTGQTVGSQRDDVTVGTLARVPCPTGVYPPLQASAQSGTQNHP